MSKPYSLNVDVRSVLAETSLSDPGEIADKVAESVPARALRDTLRLTLRAYVREIIRAERASTSGSGHQANDIHTPNAAAGKSWKVEGVRDWRRHLDDIYSASGVWIRLGEMTFDHLTATSTERADLAARTQAQAERFAEWAALVKKHKVATFGELPSTVLAEVLS